MCDFPSWIEDKNGKSWFLEDRDIKAGIDAGIFNYWEDAIGHSAIEKMFGVRGEHKEGREGLPKEFEQSIRDGKCNRMAKTDPGNAYCFVNDLLPFKVLEGKIEGYLDLEGCTGLTCLPDNLTVGRYLNLGGCTGLTSLPENLKVGGNLYLGGCTGLTSLPDNLTVGRDLYLGGCTGLTSLPENLKVGGNLCLYTTIKHIKCNDGSLIDIDHSNVNFVLEQLQAEKLV